MRGAVGDPDRRDIGVLEAVSVISARWHVLVVGAFVVAAIMIVAGLFQPRTYTATASFMAQPGTRDAGQLSSLAQRFGIAGSLQNSPSLDFYAQLLTSRDLLEQVAREEFPSVSSNGPDAAPLFHILPLDSASSEVQVRRAISWLRDHISVSIDYRSGLLKLSVTAMDPGLAEALAAELIAALNQFNLEIRQAEARAERMFVEHRLEEARAELGAEEKELREFLRANRDFGNSPEMQFEYNRLQRQVGLRQNLVVELAQAREQARLAAARNTAIIRVVETPSGSATLSSANFPLRAIGGAAIGAFLMAVLLLAQHVFRRTPSHADGSP